MDYHYLFTNKSGDIFPFLTCIFLLIVFAFGIFLGHALCLEKLGEARCDERSEICTSIWTQLLDVNGHLKPAGSAFQVKPVQQGQAGVGGDHGSRDRIGGEYRGDAVWCGEADLFNLKEEGKF